MYFYMTLVYVGFNVVHACVQAAGHSGRVFVLFRHQTRYEDDVATVNPENKWTCEATLSTT